MLKVKLEVERGVVNWAFDDMMDCVTEEDVVGAVDGGEEVDVAETGELEDEEVLRRCLRRFVIASRGGGLGRTIRLGCSTRVLGSVLYDSVVGGKFGGSLSWPSISKATASTLSRSAA